MNTKKLTHKEASLILGVAAEGGLDYMGCCPAAAAAGCDTYSGVPESDRKREISGLFCEGSGWAGPGALCEKANKNPEILIPVFESVGLL